MGVNNNKILIYLVDDLVNLPDDSKFSGDVFEYGFEAGGKYYFELEELKEIYSDDSKGIDLFKLMRAFDKAEEKKLEFEVHCESSNPAYENVIKVFSQKVRK